jgi:parallel beta-helix repeat protein
MFMKRVFSIASFLTLSGIAFANHPVLVEGESDFDGDGLIGADEDADGDRIFGTIGAALAADFGAVNNNGAVRIVTSGRFPEILSITGSNGNVTLEAAPGVDASIDAVLAGFPGNVDRQNATGITINAPNNRSIILRNLSIRNWNAGIEVLGDSHVTIDNCRVEQNLHYGIRVQGNSRVAITRCQVIGTGYRVGAAGNSPDVDQPDPGTGIQFEGASRGLVAETQATGNFGKGLAGSSVQKRNMLVFDNDRG